MDNINQAVSGWKSLVKVYLPELSSLYSLPSLALFFPWLKHHQSLGGVTGVRDCSGFSDLASHFVKPYYYVPLVVQSNLHTLVVLSFTEEFSYYFPTSAEGTGKKLNRPARLSNEFESYRFCKRTSWFLTIGDKETVCLFRFQSI